MDAIAVAKALANDPFARGLVINVSLFATSIFLFRTYPEAFAY